MKCCCLYDANEKAKVQRVSDQRLQRMFNFPSRMDLPESSHWEVEIWLDREKN